MTKASAQTTRYVVGFLFREDCRSVVLVRKDRPAWQAGRLNGVGGKIEQGESGLEAMVREFREEAASSTTNSGWRLFHQTSGEDYELYFFVAWDSRAWAEVRTCGSEQIEKHDPEMLQEADCVPDVIALINKARQVATCLTAKET